MIVQMISFGEHGFSEETIDTEMTTLKIPGSELTWCRVPWSLTHINGGLERPRVSVETTQTYGQTDTEFEQNPIF